jgi:flagellar motor protein MotB
MRKLLLAFAVLFFALSGIITLKALSISGSTTAYDAVPEKPGQRESTPKVEELLGKFAEEQAANRALVEELQATISTLEDKLSSKSDEPQPKVAVVKQQPETRVLAVLGAGLFRSGQVIIDEKLKNAVNEFIPEILESPDQSVVIEGHTDNIPIKPSAGRRYRDNIELSFLRAKAVALILESNGIAFDRISITGYGDTRPIASNDTEEGRIKNRRVEVKLIAGNKEL